MSKFSKIIFVFALCAVSAIVGAKVQAEFINKQIDKAINAGTFVIEKKIVIVGDEAHIEYRYTIKE